MRAAAPQLVPHFSLAERALQDAVLKSEPAFNPDKLDLQAAHRTNWLKRHTAALGMPEATLKEGRVKYEQLHSVYQDFIDTAVMHAQTIVYELFLPFYSKTIKPTMENPADGRQDDVRRRVRHKYVASNIRFKLGNDDHGVFNGSDEYSAKYYGNDIRASAAFSACGLPDLVIPLQAVVDVCGFRVHASALLPISQTQVMDNGEIKQVDLELVHGTVDRGATVLNSNKTLDKKLEAIAAALNLARHQVKGTRDMTMKALFTACDNRGYLGPEEQFYLTNFARIFPPEDPQESPHLSAAERGMSIFWRFLRPEFVRHHSPALSCDANNLITLHMPDAEEHVDRVTVATKRLVAELIPDFGEVLATRPSLIGLDLTAEMHRRGINVRHLGLLRTAFWFKLSGTATLMSGDRMVITTDDFRRELVRGAQVKIKGQLYRVSSHPSDNLTERTIFLDRPYTGDSSRNVEVYTGEVSSGTNSTQLRSLILAEMVARTVKNITRFYLRELARTTKGLTPHLQNGLLLDILNKLTGALPGFHDFWSTDVFLGLRVRFGDCSVSSVERLNLQTSLVDQLPYIIRRMQEMMGFQLHANTLERLSAEPWAALELTLDDLVARERLFIRAKGNFPMLELSFGQSLSLSAKCVQEAMYPVLVTEDQPVGYWRFTERRGTSFAKNWGTAGELLDGVYEKSVRLECEGPIANEEINRAIELKRELEGRVDFNYFEPLHIKSSDQHFSVECWAKPTGSLGTVRVCVAIGKFTILLAKDETWTFAVCEQSLQVKVSGSRAATGQWSHVVGSYDGTNVYLYINGKLEMRRELRSLMLTWTEQKRKKRVKEEEELEKKDKIAKDTARMEARAEMEAFFESKNGSRFLATESRKILDEYEMKSLQKKGELAELPSKKEVIQKVKAEYSDKLYAAKAEIITKDNEAKREEWLLEDLEERALAEEMVAKPLRIGGSCSSSSSRSGSKLWDGEVAQVAVYLSCLTLERVRVHYVSGSKSRISTSERIYDQASSHMILALHQVADNALAMKRYAENLCGSLKDAPQRTGVDSFKERVSAGIELLHTMENSAAIAELMRNLPADRYYADLCCQAYRAVIALDENFFSADSHLTVDELGIFLKKFSLLHTADPLKLEVAAEMAKNVVKHRPLYFGDGTTDLAWLMKLTTASVVATIVLLHESDGNRRVLDLTACSDIIDEDLFLIADSIRDLESITVDRCMNLTESTLAKAIAILPHLEGFSADGLTSTTDRLLLQLGEKCRQLQSLNVSWCSAITDFGIDSIAKRCHYMQRLELRGCELLTDKALGVIGDHLHSISKLDISHCLQITTAGLLGFTAGVDGKVLTEIILSGCRRITDAGIIGLVRRCTKLLTMDVSGCDHLTDVAGSAITHNCWNLRTLRLSDCSQISNTTFLFDAIGDGRPAADNNMLRALIHIDLSGCARIDDEGVTAIVKRAVQLETVNLSGCELISNQGVLWLTENADNGQPRGESLRHLFLAHCHRITDDGLDIIQSKLKLLQTLDLTGCINITEEAVIRLITSCKKLQSFSLALCRNLGDPTLRSIAQHLWLEKLDLSHCYLITDEGVRALATENLALKSVNLNWCRKLTPISIELLVERCVELVELNISNCEAVTEFTITAIKLSNRQLKVIENVAAVRASKRMAASEDEQPQAITKDGAGNARRARKGQQQLQQQKKATSVIGSTAATSPRTEKDFVMLPPIETPFKQRP